MGYRSLLMRAGGLDAAQLARFGADLAECRERLREIGFRIGGDPVAAMVGEAKLFRANLVFAAGWPLGAPSSALVPAAVSIELLHLASLVHDDIIDEAVERRGVPALHVTVGRSRALVLGDLLIVAGFDAIGKVQGQVPAEVFASAVDALSEGAQLCCIGQLEELDPDAGVLSEERYLEIVAKKAGSLFSVAACLGALIATSADDELAALAALGTELGIAYQIRDDLRDGGEGEPASRFLPTFETYARALDRVRSALHRVPAASNGALRALVEAALDASAAPGYAYLPLASSSAPAPTADRPAPAGE